MKKILCVLIILYVLIIDLPVFAADKSDYKIVKENSKYILTDKNSGNKVFPFQYDKIRKIKYDKKLIITGENQNYITVYSPDGIYDDFLKKYYLSNRYNSGVKFNNYPDNAVIIYEQDKKYGLIAVENGILRITKPLYEKITYPDEKSIISMFLNVSFAPYESIIAYSTYLKGQCRFQTLEDIFNEKPVKHSTSPVLFSKLKINEDITINQNSMSVTYSGIEHSENAVIVDYSKKLQLQEPLYSPDDLYSILNYNYGYKVMNYPDNLIIKSGYHLYSYRNGAFYQITMPCSDFYIQESLFKTLTGLDISFQNPSSIIAKNGGWGIITDTNDIKTPFIYDKIYPLKANTFEDLQYDNNKQILQFIEQQNPQYYLANKGFSWGIINDVNEIIVPFETKMQDKKETLSEVTGAINKKIYSDEAKSRRNETIRSLPYVLLEMLVIPIWLILPYPFSFYADVNYF